MAAALSLRDLSGRLARFLHHEKQAAIRPSKNDLIRTGDFEISLASHQATVRGQTLDLSPEEFEMLVFLAGHPRRIITRRTLLATRWGGQNVRQVSFLEVLASLRKKIDAVDCSARYISTEPWVFYRFEPCSQPKSMPAPVAVGQ
jgi:DNA-binding response OmpR family regulator